MPDHPTVHTSFSDAYVDAVEQKCGLYEVTMGDGEDPSECWVATNDARRATAAVVDSLGISTKRLTSAEMLQRAAAEFKQRNG